ncbi:MAG TPA: creatininase family protein, partial [Opitutaceae bacterium]|nr:creatininase family protein [Opitutaceae bacterium]
MDRAVCEYPARLDDSGKLRPERAPATFAWITEDISQSGVMGDATTATLEKGQFWLRESARRLADRIIAIAGPNA